MSDPKKYTPKIDPASGHVSIIGDDIKGTREAAADTNAGLYIRCLKFYQGLQRSGGMGVNDLAAFASSEINRERDACASYCEGMRDCEEKGTVGYIVANNLAVAIRRRGG